MEGMDPKYSNMIEEAQKNLLRMVTKFFKVDSTNWCNKKQGMGYNCATLEARPIR